MPVPDTYSSRRYGRDTETTYSSSYSRAGGLGGGRSSYLTYSSSKSSSTLPPRPPAYEYRKYTGDTSLGGGSRFLSSSTSRVGGRDYGSSSAGSYRSSVSPVRASAASIRRQLETTAPTIAERIKAMELDTEMGDGNRVSDSSTRLSRFSTMRSRDSPMSSTYTSPYRDRSGSKEYSNGPLISGSRGDSTKSSSENLRSRTSPTGSRSGMKNGLSHLGSSNEVNSENAISASKGFDATTTTTSPTTKNGSVDDDLYVDKCAKDVENNDSDGGRSTASSPSLISATSSKDMITLNGFSSSKKENDKSHDSENGVSESMKSTSNKHVLLYSSENGGSSSSGVTSKPLFSVSSNISSVLGVDEDNEMNDSNGNPIVMTTPSSQEEVKVVISEASGSRSGSRKGSPSVDPTSPAGARKAKTSRFLKKCEADSNANNLEDTSLQNGELVVESTIKSPRSTNSTASSNIKTSPKVLFHTIQVEEPTDSRNTSVSPEPVYTLTARPSLDGTGPKIEIKSVTKGPQVSDTISAEFKVTLPKLKSSSTSSSSPESVHNNKTATNSEEDADDNIRKTTTSEELDAMNDPKLRRIKPKESSPVPTAPSSTPSRLKKGSTPPIGKLSISSSTTPERETLVKQKSTTPSRRSSISKSRETTPKETEKVARQLPTKEKTPPSTRASPAKSLVNGERQLKVKENISTNGNEDMGPHSSKYGNPYESARPFVNGPQRQFGTSYRASNASDSSDNDSDAVTSSPRLSGRDKFRPSKDGFEKAGLTGLRNIGNTCFMNTVLQCLSNTRPLLEYVVKDNYESDINRSTSGMKGALMRAFADLLHELWRDKNVVDTSAFKDSIQRFAPRFMGYSQQDAQEFLRYLLEGLHEDVNKVTAKPTPITTDIDDSLSDAEKASESWRRYMRYECSKIVDMFVGQFKSTLKCTVCGHCSVTFDPFWDLSLPIPGRGSTVKLIQCFELLNKEEVLDGDEKPTCAKCQTRRKCTKTLSIQKFPKILVVHLKRFSLAERYRGKLSTLVDFPLNGLDLTPYAARSGNVASYNLYGVANHSGSTYSGHYIAYCKHPYSGEWHCYNDSRVSPISTHSVVSSEGYVLFYEQTGQSSML